MERSRLKRNVKDITQYKLKIANYWTKAKVIGRVEEVSSGIMPGKILVKKRKVSIWQKQNGN